MIDLTDIYPEIVFAYRMGWLSLRDIETFTNPYSFTTTKES